VPEETIQPHILEPLSPPLAGEPTFLPTSLRDKYVMEEGDMRSRNYVAGKQGWRLFPTRVELNDVREAVYVQSITDNGITRDQITYRGWGYKDLSALTSGTITITIPNGGFDDAAYDASAIYLGEKATAPTSRNDVTSHKIHTVTNLDATVAYSPTQFAISFYSNGGGNFGFVVFSWMAIGTKT